MRERALVDGSGLDASGKIRHTCRDPVVVFAKLSPGAITTLDGIVHVFRCERGRRTFQHGTHVRVYEWRVCRWRGCKWSL